MGRLDDENAELERLKRELTAKISGSSADFQVAILSTTFIIMLT